MNIYAASSMITAIASVLLGIFVLAKNPTNKINRIWFYTSFSIFLWTFSLYWCFNAQDEQSAFFWQKLLYIGTALIPITFYNFIILLTRKIEDKRHLWVMRFGYLICLFFLFSISYGNFLFVGVGERMSDGYWPIVFSDWYYSYLAYFAFYVAMIWFVLWRESRMASGIRGKQIKLVACTALVGFVGGSFNFLLDFGFSYPIGNLFVVLYVFFMAYAITKYRLLDIKSFVRRSTIFAFLVALIAVLFVIFSNYLFFLFERYLGSYAQMISAVLSAIIVVICYEPIKKLIEKITDRFLFIKSYSSSQVLSEVSTLALSEINLSKLLELLEQKLKNIFFFKKISFLFLDEKGRLNLIKQSGFDQKQLSDFARGKEKYLPWYFTGNKNIKVIPELKDAYEAGEYQPKSLDILNGLFDMDVSLVVPLFVKESLIGIILIGDKRSNDLYTQDDINTIGAIAGQLAMAIENARLYEKQKRFNQDLKIEVKRATERLVAANKELQRLDDAKSEFLSIASHQLRTPTTIIRGYISMMQEGSFGPVPSIIQENLKKVNSATDRLLSLIESLLDISRMEAGRLEFDIQPTDLSVIAKSLIDDFKKKADDKKLKFDFYFPKSLPKVLADPNKVKEVASNLIDNSIKYTPKGEVSVGLHQEGSSVVFSVQDTGLGVEPEDLPRLFNKFVRGKDMVRVHTEGTGLGLYFARVVIENMGGRIWAESPGKNQGSKFCFSLPLADKGKAKKVK